MTSNSTVSNIDLLLSTLRSAASDSELTAALLPLPGLSSLLSPAQAELIWNSLPPGYLSRLAASSLPPGKDTPFYARLFTSLLSSMRSSPSILHSLPYLQHSPLLMEIAYGGCSAPSEARELSLECLECVHYIPESLPYLLQANVLSTLIVGYSKHKRVSCLILSSLQDSIIFPDYSHQVTEVLYAQLSIRGQKEKSSYCEDISTLLNAFSANSLPITDSLLHLIGELFILMKSKEASRRLLPVRAASRLLSLYDLYTLCQRLNTDNTIFGLSTLLDMLLLLTNLILIDFKLWLDECSQSGAVSSFTAALPQLGYARQLLRLMERLEEEDCQVLKGADKCYHFICSTLNVIQDISTTLMHLLLIVSQRGDSLSPTLSQSLLRLLAVFLSDHDLDTHSELLSVLSPVLVGLQSKFPPSHILGELNKFDVSLLQDASYLCSFLSTIVDSLNETMLDFLPAALNFCQHSALSLRLAESGYYCLLLLYYANHYTLPVLNKTPLDTRTDNRSVIVEILSTLSPHFISLVPADSPVLRLAAALLLASTQDSAGSEERESETRLIALLMSAVSANLSPSLPQQLPESLPDTSS